MELAILMLGWPSPTPRGPQVWEGKGSTNSARGKREAGTYGALVGRGRTHPGGEVAAHHPGLGLERVGDLHRLLVRRMTFVAGDRQGLAGLGAVAVEGHRLEAQLPGEQVGLFDLGDCGRAHVRTPVTLQSHMPS